MKRNGNKSVPIHPEHLNRLPENIRRKLIFEKGYGKPFNISDEELAMQTGGLATRAEILQDMGQPSSQNPCCTI